MYSRYVWNQEIEFETGRVFDFKCPFCGVDILLGGHYERAHIVPNVKGGPFVPGNIVLTCVTCNRSMTHNHAFKWCKSRGIDYSHIPPKLAYLRRKFKNAIGEPHSNRNYHIERDDSGNPVMTERITIILNETDVRRLEKYAGEYLRGYIGLGTAKPHIIRLLKEIVDMEIKGYVTTSQAAEIIGVTVGRVRQLIADETLDSEKLGNVRLIKVESVESYRDNRPQSGWPKGKKRKSDE